MKNRLNTIKDVSTTVDNGNCWNKTCRRLTTNNMNWYTNEKFKKYKRDWNYPVQVVRNQKRVVSVNMCSNFQTAIKVVIIVGQCFGLNPVLGVCERNAAKLRFTVKSWRCMFTFLTMMGQFTMVPFLIIRILTSSTSAVNSATDIIFYTFALVTTMLFLRIAMKWPKMCMDISAMEATDPTTDCKLKRKLNIWCFLILSTALLEHLFSELHLLSLAIDCEPETPLYEAFIRISFPWVFFTLPYNNFIGALYHIINIQCTFNWNFTDLFVICMSLYLTSRLEQVNERVVAAKDKILPSTFWRTLREDYSKATRLVRKVDKIIGGVIFISFANNLFFICSQLLHTLSVGIQSTRRCKENSTTADGRLLFGYEHSIYFVFSFVFLVARSLAVSLTAARVHSASLEPSFALYDVSSATYCVEIQRFLNQIHGNTVALSGLQFFNVKRGMILTIAGTIVTYELVLMQFTGITPTSPTPA